MQLHMRCGPCPADTCNEACRSKGWGHTCTACLYAAFKSCHPCGQGGVADTPCCLLSLLLLPLLLCVLWPCAVW